MSSEPLTDRERAMLTFAYRSAGRPSGLVQDEILRDFGVHPYRFWMQVAALCRTDAARREFPVYCRQILGRTRG